MKNNRRIVCLGVVALALTLLASICFGFAGNNTAFADSPKVEDVMIADTYKVGDKFVAPKIANVVYKGKNYDGSFYALILPNGSGVKTSSYVFDAVGMYKVIYNITEGAEQLQATKSIYVTEKNWAVSSAESSVEYGSINTHKDTKGLNLTLSRGDVFTFSQPIKLNADGPTDIITFFPEQLNQLKSRFSASQIANGVSYGNYEAERLIVTLTDCYNPEIYVDLILYFNNNPDNGYNARTRAVGQGEYGLVSQAGTINANHLPTVTIDGQTYGYWKGQWGQGVAWMTGASVTNVTWHYDLRTNQVFYSTASQTAEQARVLVNDLDNKDITPSTFPGFTTDEVYVSISAADYLTNSASFQVESIGNVSGDQLGSTECIDEYSPLVVPQTKNATGDIYAQVGMEFPLFDALVYDGNLIGSVSKKVYYNYGTPMQSAVLVKDGKFIPAQQGIYTIEYSAKDAFGNVGKATVPVIVVAEEVVKFSTTNVTSAKAGEPILLPEYTVSSKNGDVKVSIQAIAPDGSVVDIDINNDYFTLTNVGVYQIKYTYEDKIRSYTHSYNLNVEENSSYGIIEMPSFKEVYIKGASYQIDTINAYTFGSATPQASATTLYVSFDGGDYQMVNDPTSVVISGSQTVKFKYVVNNVTVYETEKALPIKDVGYTNYDLKIEKYFEGDFTSNKTSSYIDFTSNVENGNNQLSFDTNLVSELFSVKYALPNRMTQFATFDIILTDHAGDKVTLSHKNSSGVLNVSINGSTRELKGSINDGLERSIHYDSDARAFVFSDISGTISVPFEMEIDKYCKVSFAFTGLTANATLRLYSIYNQLMCTDTSDYFNPLLLMTPSKGYAEVGSKAVATAALACDVLSEINDCNFTLSVLDPEGNAVKDDNGLLLENVSARVSYTFTLQNFGDYTVEYYVKDAAGRTTFNAYIITSADITAPTITFKDKKVDSSFVQEMKVGYKYKIKEFSVKDNDTATENLEVHILVYNANGQLLFADVNEITPRYEGRYTVYIYCLDSAGNSTYVSYQLNVVAE